MVTTEGALGLTQGFVISFQVKSTGRWAILLLLSSQASKKMLGELLKKMYRTSMSDLVPPAVGGPGWSPGVTRGVAWWLWGVN